MMYRELFPDDLKRYEGKAVGMRKADGDNFEIIVSTIEDTYKKERCVRLVNKHGNDYTKQFPEITIGLGVKKDINCILNGEVAYWDKEQEKFDFPTFRGRQGLQKQRDIMIRRLRYPCKTYIFDLIEYNGISMINNPDYPFSRRYEILKSIITDNNTTELLPIREDLQAFFEEECLADREGIMVKCLHNIYSEGRTDTILKCKNWKYEKIKFTDYEENPNGTITLTNETDRVLCASTKHTDLIKATIIQSGYAEEVVRHLQNRTKNGKLREPSWKPKEKYLNMCNPT